MEKELKNYRLFFFCAMIYTFVAAAVATVYLGMHYDSALMLYDKGASRLPVAALICAGAILSFVFALNMRKTFLPTSYIEKNSNLMILCAMFCAGALALTVALQLISKNSSDHLYVLWSGPGETARQKAASALLKVNVAAAVPAAICFGYTAFTGKIRAIPSILISVWMLVYLLRLYYDMSVPMNDPLCRMSIVSICAALLYSLAELRYAVSKPSPFIHVFSGSASMIICGICGFSKAALIIAGKLDFGISGAYAIAESALALYALARMMSFVKKEGFFFEGSR